MITLAIGVTGVGASAALTAALTARGLHQVRPGRPGSKQLLAVAGAIGGLVGIAVLVTAGRSDGWILIPVLALWGCVLAAAGLCDAVTQRIPTVLVRPGVITVAVLFAIGFTAVRDWQGLALSGVASLATAVTMLACWRFLEAGLGDVRLALLGGLGLGRVDSLGLCLGIGVFAAIVLGQVITRRLRRDGSETRVPLGPALAAGFILAAVL